MAVVAVTVPPVIGAAVRSARAAGPTYRTRGVVKSFGPDRAYVNIAHEAIPGYMGAMTMSFEPRARALLASLSTEDAIIFVFTAEDDGRRVIESVYKE